MLGGSSSNVWALWTQSSQVENLSGLELWISKVLPFARKGALMNEEGTLDLIKKDATGLWMVGFL